jgi:hypothetical protein
MTAKIVSIGNTPNEHADKTVNKHGDDLVLPDDIFQESIGEYGSVLVLGWDKEGSMKFVASNNFPASEKLWLMETAKLILLKE